MYQMQGQDQGTVAPPEGAVSACWVCGRLVQREARTAHDGETTVCSDECVVRFDIETADWTVPAERGPLLTDLVERFGDYVVTLDIVGHDTVRGATIADYDEVNQTVTYAVTKNGRTSESEIAVVDVLAVVPNRARKLAVA